MRERPIPSHPVDIIRYRSGIMLQRADGATTCCRSCSCYSPLLHRKGMTMIGFVSKHAVVFASEWQQSRSRRCCYNYRVSESRSQTRQTVWERMLVTDPH